MIISFRQKFNTASKVSEKIVKKLDKKVAKLYEAFTDAAYKDADSFFAYASEKNKHLSVISLANEKTKKRLPKTLFVVGIGGANLAAKAIYDSVLGYAEGIHDFKRKIIFVDTVDVGITAPVELAIRELEDLDDFLVVIVSKSGKTIETLTNVEFLISRLETKFPNVIQKIVVITERNSPLWNEAMKKNISLLELSPHISDRFAAFSPATLFPLAAFGFLINDFLDGAKTEIEQIVKGKSKVKESSIAICKWKNEGFSVYDLFFFTPRLETLGKWQKQLISESLGKKNDISGGEVHSGILPTVSIGTTDLHSSLQLTLGGPTDKITVFVSIKSEGSHIGDAKSLDVLPADFLEKTTNEVNQKILSAVQESYTKRGLPFFDMVLPELSIKVLGAYMAFSMVQVVLLGELWNIDVYSQPEVEEYKERTRELLK